ncbi:MAG: hypothetical protein GC129_05475 [Proteobacteria bacterium]|nr:hypothetical protein [Pseudomonadota bacterium]
MQRPTNGEQPHLRLVPPATVGPDESVETFLGGVRQELNNDGGPVGVGFDLTREGQLVVFTTADTRQRAAVVLYRHERGELAAEVTLTADGGVVWGTVRDVSRAGTPCRLASDFDTVGTKLVSTEDGQMATLLRLLGQLLCKVAEILMRVVECRLKPTVAMA